MNTGFKAILDLMASNALFNKLLLKKAMYQESNALLNDNNSCMI